MADNSIPTIIPPPNEVEHNEDPMRIDPAPVPVGSVPAEAHPEVPITHHFEIPREPLDGDLQPDVQPASTLHQLATNNLHDSSPMDALSNVNTISEGGAGPSHVDSIVVPEPVQVISEPAQLSEEAQGKKKRMCRHPGCNRVIKSQGLCQRHGGKAKRCKVPGCDKQAQGTHDGMCKRHWKIKNCAGAVDAAAPKEEDVPPPPEGTSVYDGVLPESIAYRPTALDRQQLEESNVTRDTDNPVTPPAELSIMPLVLFLRDGANQEFGWHRNAERRARGMFPCTLLTLTFEPWERQLCLIETMLLSGGTAYANFRDLSHAWGRDVGFHHSLSSSVCERRGEVDRKKRSELGKRKAREEAESREKMEQLIAIENAASTLQCLPASNPPQMLMPMTQHSAMQQQMQPPMQMQQQMQQQVQQQVQQQMQQQMHPGMVQQVQPVTQQPVQSSMPHPMQSVTPSPAHLGMLPPAEAPVQPSLQPQIRPGMPPMQVPVHPGMQVSMQPNMQPQMQAAIQQLAHSGMHPELQPQMQQQMQPELNALMQSQMQTILQAPMQTAMQTSMQSGFQASQQSPPLQGMPSDGNGNLIGL